MSLLDDLVNDELLFAETFVRVVDMSSHGTQGKLVPFRLDAMPMQRDFVDRIIKKRRTRVVELKARRVGGTTLFMVLGLVRAILNKNFHVGLIAQNEPESIRFGRMWKQLYMDMIPKVSIEGMEFVPRPDAGVFSDHLIEFPQTGSFVTVGTAGSTKLWRGQSFNMIIGTEVSKWDVGRPVGTAEETWAGAVGSLVPGGLAILESTAYGTGGFFYDVYEGAKRGDNGWAHVFYDWRWHPIYQLGIEDDDTLQADRGPVVQTDEEMALGLTEGQARWRRSTLASMTGSTPEARLALFLQEYPEDDVTCFTTSGSPFFDIRHVDDVFRRARPIMRSEESGCLSIWQTPRVGENYVIGVDPGGEVGARGSKVGAKDFAAATVVDGRGNHVASLHGRWDSKTFAELLVTLANRYNEALIVVESGPYGDAVLLVLAAYLQYKYIYSEKDPVSGKPIKMGKRTTIGSKPSMADNFKELFETGTFDTHDRDLLGEMRNFHRVPSESGRIGLRAIAGHDDRVMSAMLALWAWTEGGWRRGRKGTKIHIPGRG